ncbi:MAG: ABC transporter ATP-binding protein [Lachnospiraceae bacterium]|nr:ABC transporter ATP-binding protein [Lachnospiraceae bacterium]
MAKGKSEKKTEDLNVLYKLNKILDGRQKRQFLFLGVLILIGGLLETLGVSMLLPVVTMIVDAQSMRETIDKIPFVRNLLEKLHIVSNTQIIITLLAVLIVVYIVKNLYLLFMIRMQNTFVARSKNDMISRVMREFLNRPYEEYLAADIPTTFRITDADIPQVFALIMALLQLMTEIVVSFCLFIVLLAINWKMTFFIVLIFALMTLFNSKVLKPRLNQIGKKNQETASRIAKWRIQSIYGLKDVKVLNRQDFFIRNYYESGKTGADLARDYAVLNNLPRLLIETVFMAAVLGFIMVFLLRGGNIAVMATQLVAFAGVAVRVMPSANRINTYIAEIAYEEPNLNFVYDNLNESMKLDTEMRALHPETSGEPLALNDRIELNHITFRYPGGDRNIFTDAHMEVPHGKSVGIMGPSGAGKSTIVDILLGLLHVQEGEILCDGRDIFSNYESWLSLIGYIPQSIYLIDESIRDNIAFGIDADQIDDERIWEVMREAQLADFVRSLPEGLDTKIGDRGVRLSGGQRQRIGIARALYADPEILVFDEATSALDNETEEALMEAINSFHGRKTMVIIAHRLNTIAGCDVIYKVEDEKIEPTTLEGRVILETAHTAAGQNAAGDPSEQQESTADGGVQHE